MGLLLRDYHRCSTSEITEEDVAKNTAKRVVSGAASLGVGVAFTAATGGAAPLPFLASLAVGVAGLILTAHQTT